MVKEFHDSNGEYMPVPNELDSFAEFSSDKFRNLDEVEEFHDKTAEFPMDIETDSAVIAGAAMGAASIEEGSEGSKETEEEKREKGRSGKATKELIKNATNVSSAQALVPVAAGPGTSPGPVQPLLSGICKDFNCEPASLDR